MPIINKYISENNIKRYYEPFAGGMNVIDKIVCEKKYASDNNVFLIELFKHLEDIKNFPDIISKEHYSEVRDEYNKYKKDSNTSLKYPMWYIGAVGFLASYNGRFFDGGYSGIIVSKTGNTRNYYLEAKINILKQFEKLKDVEFKCCDYRDLNVRGGVIYSDPPYEGTTHYCTSHGFNHEEFWDWCRDKAKDNIVLISEQKAPDDFECIWEKPINRNIVNNSKRKLGMERLYIAKGGIR